MSNSLLTKMKEDKKDSVADIEHNITIEPSDDPCVQYKSTNHTEKKYIVKPGPNQPKLPIFPEFNDIPLRKQRPFPWLWYDIYPHLEYSIAKDAAFCYVCSLFHRVLEENKLTMHGPRMAFDNSTKCPVKE